MSTADRMTQRDQLIALLRRQIAGHGPVTFKWFMQQALYHPEFGYYAGGRARIGRRGDFYTSVSVSRIFGELMAKQFEEMWLRMNAPVTFAIVEEGAHGGHFADDVLTWLQKFSPDLYECARYWIVEPSPALQAEQQARLSKWPRNKVRWCPALASFEAGSLNGVHFSNELLDSFPVHLVTYGGNGWEENFVDLTRDGFRFVYGPPSNSPLRAHLQTLPVPPEQATPYQTEVNLAALRWAEDLSKVIRRGYVLTADYGYPRSIYYAPERREGTLMGYRQHERNPDPFEFAGEADITAHVDFTSLAERAEEHGLKLAGYCDQHHFLIGLGQEELLQIEQDTAAAGEPPSPDLVHYINAFKTLMHPSTMGMAFKFICFQRLGSDVPGTLLSGFRYAGDYRAALGLGESGTTARLRGDPEDPYAPF